MGSVVGLVARAVVVWRGGVASFVTGKRSSAWGPLRQPMYAGVMAASSPSRWRKAATFRLSANGLRSTPVRISLAVVEQRGWFEELGADGTVGEAEHEGDDVARGCRLTMLSWGRASESSTFIASSSGSSCFWGACVASSMLGLRREAARAQPPPSRAARRRERRHSSALIISKKRRLSLVTSHSWVTE